MNRIFGAGLVLGLAAVATVGLAQTGKLQHPLWAYAVPAAATPTPIDDGAVLTLTESDKRFTLSQVRGDTPTRDPADWYPGDHPAMPKIVAQGGGPAAVTACALCHYPNGKGRSENAGLAGLPRDYIVEQLHDMRSGARASAEPQKANAIRMLNIAKGMTEDEIQAAATYFASMPWSRWERVVETATAPKTRNNNGLLLTLTGAEAGTEPLGRRIIETPEDARHSEVLRDPRSSFVAYVPLGSIARGKAIVTTGDGGKTLPCATCHGADLGGVGPIPGIAARSPSYVARQLNDFQQGTRAGAMGALMKPVVAKLTEEDELAIAAYLASLPAPKPVG